MLPVGSDVNDAFLESDLCFFEKIKISNEQTRLHDLAVIKSQN
jgi:hypothetical protein